jgi:hypothetical protein
VRKRYAVLFEQRALRELDEARAWWAEHRQSSAFDNAMARTLDRLEQLPLSAPRVQIAGKWSSTRAAPLGRTGYKLYYWPNTRAKSLLVIRIWHERRPGLLLQARPRAQLFTVR